MRFGLNGNSNFQTENFAPYSLAGDNNGDYRPFMIMPGSYTISATPYEYRSAGGAAGNTLTITVQVISSSRNGLEMDDADRIMFYPNPTSDRLVIDMMHGEAGDVEIKLYNLLGDVVLERILPNGFRCLESEVFDQRSS